METGYILRLHNAVDNLNVTVNLNNHFTLFHFILLLNKKNIYLFCKLIKNNEDIMRVMYCSYCFRTVQKVQKNCSVFR